MTPLDREYLYLDEATTIPGLSKFDIIELIRLKKINAYAWSPKQKLNAIGRLVNEQKNSTLGNFVYEGIIKIPNLQASNLLDEQKHVYVTFVTIMQPNLVQNWDVNSPDIPYPNNQFINHAPQDTAPITPFLACSEISSLRETTEPFYDLLFNGLKAFTDVNPDNEVKARNELNKSLQEFERKASINSIKIPAQNFRFSKNEVHRVLGIEKQEELIATSSAKVPSFNKALSPIDEMILRAYQDSPGRSDHIWNIIRIEFNTDSFEKKYDLEEILLEMSSASLVWKNPRNNKEKSLTRESFKNKISKLRKHESNS